MSPVIKVSSKGADIRSYRHRHKDSSWGIVTVNDRTFQRNGVLNDEVA